MGAESGSTLGTVTGAAVLFAPVLAQMSSHAAERFEVACTV